MAAVIVYAGLTAWQASSTAGQLKEARRSNEATVKNFKMGQRAWVGPNTVELPTPVPEQPLVWRITYKNFGNSPAFNVQIRDTAQLLVKREPVTEMDVVFLSLKLPKEAKESITMFNGATYTNTGGINFALYAPQVDQVKHGEALIVYLAEISYRDIFGETHITKTCDLWSPVVPSGAKNCGVGEFAN